MAQSQEEIAAKKLRECGKRRWKNYRWTNEMYDALLAIQDGKCAVCGKRPKEGGMNLVIDHYHFKITTRRTNNSEKGWFAECCELTPIISWGKTKSEAVKRLRDGLLPLSVRGLLCPGRHGKAGHGACNRLIGRVDNVEWLKKVIAYLENPPANKILDNRPKVWYSVYGGNVNFELATIILSGITGVLLAYIYDLRKTIVRESNLADEAMDAAERADARANETAKIHQELLARPVQAVIPMNAIETIAQAVIQYIDGYVNGGVPIIFPKDKKPQWKNQRSNRQVWKRTSPLLKKLPD
jgi:Recombination endonuclease VII